MWIKKPFFEYAFGILLVAIILYFVSKLNFLLFPLQVIITTIFAPVLLAGLLYYILRPPLRLLTRRIPRPAGILVLFSAILILVTLTIYYFGPTVKNQAESLVELAPQTLETTVSASERFLMDFELAGMTGMEMQEAIVGYAESVSEELMGNIIGFFGFLLNLAVVLIVVPFILFFLLKDDDKFIPATIKYLPEDRRPEGEKLMRDVDKTLSDYIVGQVTVALIVGVLMYIGYLIIDIDYALALAIFAMFLIIVPFLGPLIGIMPALAVSLMNGDWFMALKVVIVLLVVQQLEGNLITPNIMGSRLNIHPLTIILLLLVAAALYGFVGILVAIPAYAVLKTLLHNFRLFMRLRKKREVAHAMEQEK
ncbi:AI-2E family transporter [Planomicrobium sp. YIM 101495]|uniref:AI-2E family transporter n=1 Tax=Planomicrobium sp. YIM 101495 TaxID=2665160 RepID=UPI0012B7BB8D|nr:AI-2E family transporter [Planomicrobium sp. YIM 101495]MTD31466.1 AI-2E family transporter [Planomicrobium sp. YIM 101495]